MLLRIAALLISVMYVATCPAVPIAETEPCNQEQSDCSPTNNAKTVENAVASEAGKEQAIAAKEARAFMRLGFVDPRLVALGLSRVLDEKTALMHNTAMYPRGNGDRTIGNFLTGRTNPTASDGTFPDRFSGNNNFGNSRWRDWASPKQKSRPDRYRGSKKQEKIAEQEASWISKTASSIEYFVVGILCFVFWLWFRQSKAY